MPGTPTTKHNIPTLVGADLVKNGPSAINSALTAIDGLLAPSDQGLFTSRPTSTPGTPGIIGRTYKSTDGLGGESIARLFRDNGTGWDQINPTIEPFIAATFQNGWANFNTAVYAAAGYFKDSNGIVYLLGTIKPGTNRLAAFTLPAGYRPLKLRPFPAITGNNTSDSVGRVDIFPDGTVVPWTIAGGTGIYLSIDSVRFRAEQ